MGNWLQALARFSGAIFPGAGVIGIAVVALSLVGCDDHGAIAEPGTDAVGVGAAAGSSTAGGSGAEGLAAFSGEEAWYAYYLAGQKAGYRSVSRRTKSMAGQRMVVAKSDSTVTFQRSGARSRMKLEVESTEAPDGQLVQFGAQIDLGASQSEVAGRVDGDAMALVVTTLGKETETSIPGMQGVGGPFADEHSLLAKPMKEGERRVVKTFQPVFNVVATIEMEAGSYETLDVLGEERRLLKIDRTTRMPGGQVMQSMVWTDESGAVVRALEDPGLEMVRVSREAAMARSKAPDLIDFSFVEVNPPIRNPYEKQRIRFRVALADADPAAVFPQSGNQAVRGAGGDFAEIEVFATASQRELSSDSDITSGSLQPNNLVQSDHPRIRAMAEQGSQGEEAPEEIARSLETYVHEKIRKKDFSQAFSTALEVAQKPEGDCTEHAVLLAALARAKRIPARVAMGLVYVQGQGGFGYHMWNELYVDEQWRAFDATFGDGGITATHIKLADSDLAGESAYGAFLPVAKVLGKLQIEVLEAE